MKISCPACAAKYSIADEKVSERLAKIRCRKCGATIVIDGKVSPPHVYTAAGDAPDADSAHEHHEVSGVSGGASYSVDFGEGDQRTLTVVEIVAAYNAGQVTAETYLWADGFADWKPLGDIPEVVDALHAATSAPAVAPSPWDKPAAKPMAARAAARGGRAGGGDLFGRIEAAGSEEEVTTSAADAAAQMGGGSATGARNESSVLFSLSALTSAASRPSSRPGPSAASASASSSSSGATREDSGLIDLKALTAAATKSEAAAPPPIVPLQSPLGVAAPPLGIAAPFGGGGITSAADVMYPQKSKTGLYIGAGLAVAAVIIAFAFILRPEPPPAPPPVVAAPTPTTPAAAPTDTPEPLTAKPPSTGAEDDAGAAPKVASKSGAKRYGGGGAKKPGGGGAPAPATGGGDAPKPAAAKRPCGCAPADLQCNMRCSAGG